MATTTDIRVEPRPQPADETYLYVSGIPPVDPGVEPPGDGLRYSPHLDGLRCLAVYLVVAFHARLPGFAGGFVGVDLFFVLSGFLVTRILLRDLVNRDRIDFVRFYARRFRRILPAAATMLVLAGLVYAAVATPLEVANVAGGFRASFLYSANWHFIHQSTDYFAPSVAASPVLHVWSLAVEEQFYLAWPLLLGGMYLLSQRAGNGRWWALRVMVAALAVVSLVDALHYNGAELSRAYYGTDTRAYQLLAGALLALTPQLVAGGRGRVSHRRARARSRVAAGRGALVAVAALAVLGSSFLEMSPITRGAFVVVAAMVLIVALERSSVGILGRGLSNPRVAYLGRISFGTYLWQWPVIVVITHNRDLDPATVFVITAIVATTLAALSYHVIEHPIRVKSVLDSRGSAIIAVALGVSLTAGLLISPALQDTADHGVHIANISVAVPGLDTGRATLLDWRRAQRDIPAAPECLGHPLATCTLVRGSGKRILLMGDSLARMWLPAFVEIAKRESLTLVVASHPSCPWPADLEGLSISADCPDRRSDWYRRVIPAADPDVVFLANRAYDAPHNTFTLGVGGRLVNADDPAGVHAITTATAQSIQLLRRPGRQFVIMEPTPLPSDVSYDPLSCVSSGSAHCAFRDELPVTPLDRSYQDLAQASDVAYLPTNQLACPRLPICDPVVNGIIVRRDHTHLTGTYVRALTGPLEAAIRNLHVLG